ncbi:MAG: class I SAM-dependent methyltransferase [Phycisphaerae bacterium]|jgi:SAM-dependent methyltransferase
MAGEIDERAGDAYYNEFYKEGGWSYSYWREWWWHWRHVVRRFGLGRGLRVLEVACGSGFHTNLLNRMGFDCVGVDRSESGIEWARRRYPRSSYHRCDFREMPFDEASFDVVFARGFSYYHYDLASVEAHEATDTLMSYVRPGGVFVMIIATDLSGKREPGRIWQNTLDDYRDHFSSFSKYWAADWVKGVAICALWNVPAAAPATLDAQRALTAAPA